MASGLTNDDVATTQWCDSASSAGMVTLAYLMLRRATGIERATPPLTMNDVPGPRQGVCRAAESSQRLSVELGSNPCRGAAGRTAGWDDKAATEAEKRHAQGPPLSSAGFTAGCTAISRVGCRQKLITTSIIMRSH